MKMKNSFCRGFECLRCFVKFYLLFICVLGLGVGVFGSYLLIFHVENHIPEPRNIILYFLLVPTILTLFSTVIGWWSIKKKNIPLLKFFAVLLAVTATVEISGCLWCFISLPRVNEEIKLYLKTKYGMTLDSERNWWNNLQTKHKCCGLQGPTDYHFANSIPFSCCGSDPEDHSTSSCTFLWQKGCSNTIEREINKNLIILSLIASCTAVLRIPGVFLTCCFAHKMSKERL